MQSQMNISAPIFRSDAAFVNPISIRSQNVTAVPLNKNRSCQSFRRVYAPQRPSNIPSRAELRAEVSVTEGVRHALQSRFKNDDIGRVLASFNNALSGHVLERNAGKPAHQRATSFVKGLDATQFIEDFSGDYRWVNHLQTNWTVIRDELLNVTAQSDLHVKGNNVWAPPVVEAANAYGPDWRTLVLQDRTWDPVNTSLFPKTTAILKDPSAQVPSVEAFFARQAPNTGIKLHTDDCNFILTMHLGLSIPPKQSWIEVGGIRRYWQEGKALLFNTSFFHQTMNESSEQNRIVLLLRVWHPGLTAVERLALQYLFELIDDPESHPDVQSAKLELQSRKPSRARTTGRSMGKGFGK